MRAGVYGRGMHAFVLREVEIGNRAALFEDSEMSWWRVVPPAIFDLQFEAYLEQVNQKP